MTTQSIKALFQIDGIEYKVDIVLSRGYGELATPQVVLSRNGTPHTAYSMTIAKV